MQSKTQMQWDFTVLNVTGEYTKFGGLLFLSTICSQANNP